MKKHFLMTVLCFLTFVNAALGADLAKIPIVKTKTQFLELYKTQWELFGIKEKLDEIIDETMDEQVADLMWGTKSYQLATNRNGIIDKIQEAAGFKFSPIYEKFVAELEESWGDTLRKDILDYYKETSSRLFFEFDDNPMVQAHLRQNYDSVTDSQGASIIQNIVGNLSQKYNVDSGLSVAALGGGLLVVIGRKYLEKKITQLLFRKAANAAIGKIAGAAIPIAGWIMAAWGAWDIYSMAMGSADAVRQQLHDMNQSMYTREIPQTYWEAMEPYVRDSFIFAYEQIQFAIDRGNELMNDPVVKELERDLSKAQKRFFVDRIAVLDDAIGELDIDKKNLFKHFGEDIRDASVKNFETIVLMLREGDWDSLKSWVDFVGMDECCKLFVSSSQKFWVKLPPVQTSMSEIKNLETVNEKLPEKSSTETKTNLPPLISKDVEQNEIKEVKTVIPPSVTGLDKTKFLLKAKENFIKIFNSQWVELGMSEALHEAIDKAIAREIRYVMWGWGTVSVNQSQNNITKELFSPKYAILLNDVEEKWGNTLQNDILNYYKLANVNLLVGENNPMKKADIRVNSDFTQTNINNLFEKWLNEGFSSTSYNGVSRQLYSVNEAIYLKKLPEIFWSVIEPYATEAFIQACQVNQNRRISK